jgi:regulator of cell morphogenesis and NO signaling
MQHIHLENNVLFRNAEAPARIPTVQATESAEEVRP